MSSFNLDNFKVNTNYVLEASAGTGKTYNIVKIVKQLVEMHKIPLRKILIVTYTEKAAGELKNRIREELPNENIDDASIGTIHSFCQETIKIFGISANQPLELTNITDEELVKFIKKYVREGNILKDITNIILDKEINFDDLESLFLNAINKYYLNKDYLEDSSIIKLANTEICNLYDGLKADLSFEEVLDNNPHLKEAYNVFLKYSDEERALKFMDALKGSYKDGFKFKGFSVNTAWSKDSTKKAEMSVAYQVFDDIKKTYKDFKINKYLVNKYLKDLYIRWQKEKECQKYQTFNDMIRNVRESVLNNDNLLLTKLKEKYTYGIIDEFQDTNQLQFDIFKKIFMCENHHLIVVGDPKQSIYSFQGADINVYHKAKKEIEDNGGEVCKLNKNYRSTKHMVEFCNKFFKNFDFKGTEFKDCDYLKDDVDGHEHKALYKGQDVKSFWINEGKVSGEDFAKIVVDAIIDCCTVDDNGKTHLQVSNKKEDDEPFRNVSFKDFVVLANAKADADLLEYQLKLAGIPCVRYKDTKLFQGKECADWKVLLEAINSSDLTGYNRKKFKKTLFSKFFGLNLKTISDEEYNKDSNEQMHSLKKWRVLANERRWEDLIDDILFSSKINSNLKTLSEMQSLGIYKQIGNYCIEYLSNKHSIEELINNLESLSKGSSTDDEGGIIIEKSTNFDCVRIMTMHASKGLQFPVVINVSGFKPKTSSGFRIAEAYTYLDENNQKVLDVFGKGSSEEDKEEELKRLLYVAYTRAEYLMMVPMYDEYKKKLDILEGFVSKYIDEFKEEIRFLPTSTKTLDENKEAVKKILNPKVFDDQQASLAKESQDQRLQDLIKNKSKMSSFKHSYSSLSHPPKSINEDDDWFDKEGEQAEGLKMYDKSAITIEPDLDPNIQCIEYPIDYPRGSHAGTALHDIFEAIDFIDYKTNLKDIITNKFLNQGINIKDNHIDSTMIMIENVLGAKLPVVNGNKKSVDYVCLNTFTSDNLKKELEFNFNLKEEYLKNYSNGFIDLIFRNGDYFSVLDWKSDTLKENFTSYSDIEQLKKHVDETYSIQRVLYSYCLIKWLKSYFPSLTEQQIFEKHFGGIYYVFLRGCISGSGNGIYCQTWENYDDLKKEFEYIINTKVGAKHV